jgi:hypothetical protein
MIPKWEELGWDWQSVSFLLIGLWGGFCHYIGGVRLKTRKLSLFEVAGDLTYSGFAAVMAAAAAHHMQLTYWPTVILCGMAGHMGSRSIFLLERFLRSRYKLLDDGHGPDV